MVIKLLEALKYNELRLCIFFCDPSDAWACLKDKVYRVFRGALAVKNLTQT
jgi:hypothetical protein